MVSWKYDLLSDHKIFLQFSGGTSALLPSNISGSVSSQKILKMRETLSMSILLATREVLNLNVEGKYTHKCQILPFLTSDHLSSKHKRLH